MGCFIVLVRLSGLVVKGEAELSKGYLFLFFSKWKEQGEYPYSGGGDKIQGIPLVVVIGEICVLMHTLQVDCMELPRALQLERGLLLLFQLSNEKRDGMQFQVA